MMMITVRNIIIIAYILRIVSPKNSQTLSNMQHTKQTDPLTGQHKTYKDTTLTTSQVQEAIKQSKNNNSQCPDKLNIRQLKHIGPLRLAFLTMFKTDLNKKHNTIHMEVG